MTLERIFQLRDAGAISSEEAMRMAEALQMQQNAVRPLLGVASSWVSPIAGWLAWASMITFTNNGRLYAIFEDGDARLTVAGILSGVAVLAWFVCRSSALYHSSAPVRGRVAGGFTLGLALLTLIVPLLLMIMLD
jgi:hypothetical protein